MSRLVMVQSSNDSCDGCVYLHECGSACSTPWCNECVNFPCDPEEFMECRGCNSKPCYFKPIKIEEE